MSVKTDKVSAIRAAAQAQSAEGGAEADRIIIFDTTLRDGEQSPGCSMNVEEKLRVAEILEEMGVDIIEAGFPIASNGDFEAVSEIAERVKDASSAASPAPRQPTSTAPPRRCKPAERPRIHTFISTRPLHMKYKLQMDAGAGAWRR